MKVCIIYTLKIQTKSGFNIKAITTSLLWDKLGLSVSGICAIHCLLFPVFLSILPLWSIADVVHGWAHPLFIVFLIPAVYFASRRSHYDKSVTSILVTGLVLVIIGWLVGHFWLGFIFETSVTLLGSGMLIAGHWFNYKHHRSCNNRNHDHHPTSKKTSEA